MKPTGPFVIPEKYSGCFRGGRKKAADMEDPER